MADGLIFEIGNSSNTSNGLWFGLKDGFLRLFCRYQVIDETRVAEISAAAYAGQAIDLVAVLDLAAGELWFAIDSQLADRVGFGGPLSGQWSANNIGSYGVANGTVPGGRSDVG